MKGALVESVKQVNQHCFVPDHLRAYHDKAQKFFLNQVEKGKVATLPEAKEEEKKENVEAARVEEKVSENEALQLISLLPGVNIKPIFNEVVSDEKEAGEEEKKVRCTILQNMQKHT